jgi:hypothetical protein
MAKLGRIGRRAGPLGIALAMWDLWKRLPPKQRKRVIASARKHGPRIAKQAIKARKARRPKLP